MAFFASDHHLTTNVTHDEHFLQHVEKGWQTDLTNFVQNGVPKIVFALLLAFIFQSIVNFFIKRLNKRADRLVGNTQRSGQLRTMAAILRATSYGVVGFYVLTQILAALGVSLGPFIASAGVIGLGISFGAQSIFKDMLTGIFILIENQYSVGDTIKIAGLTGVVEDLSLRVTRLRDGDGTVYIVPNSQITTVANLSRDFSVTTVNVSVDISASPDEVVPLLGSIATEIRKDPKFAALFLADPQVLGVDAIKGSEVVYPVVFKTLATQQYAPVREFRRRVRVALEEKGLLPGDPTRTFRGFTGKSSDETPDPTADDSSANSHQGQTPASHEAKIDPTTIPAITHDPFGSQ